MSGEGRGPPPEQAPCNRLYVTNLSWQLDGEGLLHHFAAFAALDARIVKERETGRSRGFGAFRPAQALIPALLFVAHRKMRETRAAGV